MNERRIYKEQRTKRQKRPGPNMLCIKIKGTRYRTDDLTQATHRFPFRKLGGGAAFPSPRGNLRPCGSLALPIPSPFPQTTTDSGNELLPCYIPGCRCANTTKEKREGKKIYESSVPHHTHSFGGQPTMGNQSMVVERREAPILIGCGAPGGPVGA